MTLRGAAGVARRSKVEKAVRNCVIECTIDGDQEARMEILAYIHAGRVNLRHQGLLICIEEVRL
jgi:hypothetical protein